MHQTDDFPVKGMVSYTSIAPVTALLPSDGEIDHVLPRFRLRFPVL